MPDVSATTLSIDVDRLSGTRNLHYGQCFGLNATLGCTDGRDPKQLQGSVAFFCGGHALASNYVLSGETGIPVQPPQTANYPNAGINQVYAVYSDAAGAVVAQSEPITLTIAPMPLTIEIQTDVTTIPYMGEDWTLVTAILELDFTKLSHSYLFAIGEMDGDVVFRLDGVNYTTGTIGNSCFAAALLRNVTAGAHRISAVYGGNHNYLGAQSAETEIYVNSQGESARLVAQPVNMAFSANVAKQFGQKDKLAVGVTLSLPGQGLMPGTSSAPGGAGSAYSGTVDFLVDGVVKASVALDATNSCSALFDDLDEGSHNTFAVLKNASNQIVQVSRVYLFSIADLYKATATPHPDGVPAGLDGRPIDAGGTPVGLAPFGMPPGIPGGGW